MNAEDKRRYGRIAQRAFTGWHLEEKFQNAAQAVIETLMEEGWSPPMSEASAAAYAEGEFWRSMEDQYRAVLESEDDGG